jgi:hypothetical protein
VPALYTAPLHDSSGARAPTGSSTVTTGESEGAGESFLTKKRGVTWSREKLKAGKFGFWTEFLSTFLGLGVDAATGMDRR